MRGDVPEPWDFSLVPFAGLLLALLDAAAAERVVEVGADRGDFTRVLLGWAEARGAAVSAVDPDPPAELLALEAERPELDLIRAPSLEALPAIEPAQAVILDGDHNHYTLSRELEAIEAWPGPLPLLAMHDVGWPHARRDSYYDPDRIPPEQRRPLARNAMVAPGNPGISDAGIEFPWVAEREGGERNGLVPAIDAFAGRHPELRRATVPAFFGLGLLWPERAPWAAEAERIVAPWEDSEMLARLESLRIAHIVDRVRMARQEQVLRSMLGSRAFALVSRLSRLAGRRGRVFSRERVRRALGE